MKTTTIHRKLVSLVSNALIGAAIAFFLMLVAVTIVSIVNDLRTTARTIRSALLTKGRTLTANNGLAVGGLAATNSFVAIRELISGAVSADDDIVYGMYMDTRHIPWVQATDAGLQEATERVGALNDSMSLWAGALEDIAFRSCLWNSLPVIEFATPVIADNERLGTIRYGLSTVQIDRLVRDARTSLLLRFPLYVALFGLIMAGIMTVSLRRARRQAESISHPIEKLAEAANVIAGGTYSTALESVASDDEIGVLARNFESMRRTVQHYTEKLEQMVEARTAQLRHALGELRRSNTELEQFAYIASHDLQEPLRKIDQFGDLLADHFMDTLGDTGRDYIRRMQKTARRMWDLINGLLAYARVATKAQPFKPVNLQTIVSEVLSDLEVRVEETQARITIVTLPVIESDALQMRQLFQNLIGNALKYHRKGVPPQIEVSSRCENNQCTVTFKDNGIGFDDKYKEIIFGVFQRLHGTSSEYSGTGVGLSVCRKIVERHGGSICASGKPDQGATFTVVLPLSHAVSADQESLEAEVLEK